MANYPSALPYVALAAPPFLLRALGRGRFQLPYLSPPWITSTAISVTGALGYAFHARLADLGGASVSLFLTDELAIRTAYLFALFSGAIAAGALACSAGRRPSAAAHLPTPSQRLRDVALLLCALASVLQMVGLGGALLDRPYHLSADQGASIFTALSTLSIGAVPICGYLFAAQSGWRKVTPVLVSCLYLVLGFAISSRQLALYPVMFAVGYFLVRRERAGITALTVGTLLSVLLLPLPLFLRGLPRHGLEPYFAHLGEFSYADVDWLASANNILVSFPITAFSAYVHPPVPKHWILVELNPLPGQYVGWYDIANGLRLNGATPFSAVGGLGNYGIPLVLLIGVLLGGALAYLDARIGHYLRTGLPLLGLIVVGMSGLAAVTSLQYNVRSFSRLVLYILAAELATRMWLYLRPPRQQGADAAAAHEPEREVAPGPSSRRSGAEPR